MKRYHQTYDKTKYRRLKKGELLRSTDWSWFCSLELFDPSIGNGMVLIYEPGQRVEAYKGLFTYYYRERKNSNRGT